jgi:hypothetical protein
MLKQYEKFFNVITLLNIKWTEVNLFSIFFYFYYKDSETNYGNLLLI